MAQTWPKDSLKSADQHGNNHFETLFMFYNKIFQFCEERFLAPLVNLLLKLNIECRRLVINDVFFQDYLIPHGLAGGHWWAEEILECMVM